MTGTSPGVCLIKVSVKKELTAHRNQSVLQVPYAHVQYLSIQLFATSLGLFFNIDPP